MKKSSHKICYIYFPDFLFIDSDTNNTSALFFEILNFFSCEGDFYFQLYRESGENLTLKQLIEYREKIPGLFYAYGMFLDKTYPKYQNRTEGDFDPRISAIGLLPINKNTYIMLTDVFHYYCETTFFQPVRKCNWYQFSSEYDKYKMKAGKIFIELGYTNCVFTYHEGLHVCLDMQHYHLEHIINGLKILGFVIEQKNNKFILAKKA